ncbi:DEKNAAC101126 [Brettanomyces naardenensis]|uniref:DEKNAAC101126 n=1 Tax=Brettanomyces naardenensis TaxID=13370 RepID=A0A448YHC3_BRENA|nr:DEKNAAC101126 [Brettanomyces naardenensis]
MSVTAPRLVEASNRLLLEAHRLGTASLESEEALNEYYRLIKASLNCLFVVLEQYKYTLDPSTEIRLCYRVSQILFNETMSVDVASEYCVRGIQLCSRSDAFYPLKVRLEVLNFQIQYHLDENEYKRSTLTYLNSLIDRYGTTSADLKVLLTFLKYRYFGMTFSSEQCLAMLKQLADELEGRVSEGNFALYQICRICEIQQMLLQSRPMEDVKKRLGGLVYQLEKHKEVVVPTQFEAILLLLNLLISVQEDDFNECKLKIVKIDTFIRRAKKDDTQWGTTNKFQIDIGIQSFELPLELTWLSFNEFSALSYFFCGVSYLVKAWDGKHRTEKLFSHCHNELDIQETQVGDSAVNVEAMTLRIDFFALLMNGYEMLADLGDETTDLEATINDQLGVLVKYPKLCQFVKDYDEGNFSSQELVAYHNLIPILFYIWAIYHQKNGNFEVAKYFYLKVRKLYSPFENELRTEQFFNDPMLTTFLQSSIGLSGSMTEPKGMNSQLYLISSMNLLTIILHDLELLREAKVAETDDRYPEYMESFSESLKMKELLIRELSNVSNDRKSDLILEQTIQCLQYASGQLSDNPIRVLDTTAGHVAPLLAAMGYYIKGKQYQNEKTKPELDNLNTRIQLFSNSYRQSLKFIPEWRTNKLGYSASLEIYKIMHSYRNYFDRKQVDAVKKNLDGLGGPVK